MQRLRGQQHHVVGDVDDVIDRPLAGRDQAALEPQRRGADRDVLEHAGGEARAKLRHLNRDRGVVVDLVAARRLRVGLPGRRGERRGGDRMRLAGDPVDAEAVDPVRVHLELEHRLGDGQDVRERRARPRPVVEDDDPARVVADPKLGLGEDHPVGDDAAQLRLSELLPVGHRRPRQRHRHRLSGGDVGRPADDRAGRVAGVDLADAEPVGVRMLLGRDDAPDDEALRRRRADVRDALGVGRAQGEQGEQIRRRDPRVAVLAQPGVRDLHRNCSRTLTSFSKNLRRSGTPCLSIAMRSIPIPNANPCTRSGS